MIDKNLRKKINDLFEYREFPKLYELGRLDKIELFNFNENLINLQAQIYYLDAYLESHWKINQNDKSKKWKAIQHALSAFGIPKAYHTEYLRNILKYEKHELQLRLNLMPTRLDTEYYYYYKSCDVKLMRRLIYEKLPTLKKYFALSDWRYFDLVTEINDDATDLKEDLDTVNGNMILIAYHELGKEATVDYFNNFLDYCQNQSLNKIYNSKHPWAKEIHSKTLVQIKKTKDILSKNKILNSNRESLLYKYINQNVE
jgi:hypothetical protein